MATFAFCKSWQGGCCNMCDIKAYEKFYDDMIDKLSPSDTLQLMLEAKTEDQRNFYRIVGNYLLQRGQKTVIERKMF